MVNVMLEKYILMALAGGDYPVNQVQNDVAAGGRPFAANQTNLMHLPMAVTGQEESECLPFDFY